MLNRRTVVTKLPRLFKPRLAVFFLNFIFKEHFPLHCRSTRHIFTSFFYFFLFFSFCYCSGKRFTFTLVRRGTANVLEGFSDFLTQFFFCYYALNVASEGPRNLQKPSVYEKQCRDILDCCTRWIDSILGELQIFSLASKRYE